MHYYNNTIHLKQKQYLVERKISIKADVCFIELCTQTVAKKYNCLVYYGFIAANNKYLSAAKLY